MSAESSDRSRAGRADQLPVEETGDQPLAETLLVKDPSQRPEERAQGIPPRSPGADLTQLRRLLLGKDYERLKAMREDIERLLALEEALGDPARQTDRVARVLSEAMLLRENRDQGVSKALSPALSDAIKATVRQNPQPVVEAVSPVIGPAIRRSVNDAIAGMLELLDKLLEHNLSWQALQWRVEAWRSGRHYSEVVLLRTLIYRVDQVMLIHRETGLLLQHVESSQAGARDPDVVGSMLTAIKDFVSDSFSVSEDSPVQTMQVGDYKVIVEQGQLAIIAAVARGNPPTELAQTIRETAETIEILYRDGLERFDGDATAFAETRPMLENCLMSQQRPTAGRRPWLAPALVGLVLLLAAGYWGFRSYQSHGLWSSALKALRAEPGIALTDATRDGDVHRVHGLRDPLARRPEEVIGPDALSALRWDWDWRPFLSAEPAFVLERGNRVLQPPATVELSLDDGVLQVSGEATQQWIDVMRSAVRGIHGIAGYRDDDLNAIDDTPRHREMLARYREEIRDTILYFGVNALQLGQDQMDRLDNLAGAMKALGPVAGELGLTPGYLVTGFADATGSREQNRRLSFSRARGVIDELVARGVGEHLFLPLKMGVDMSDKPAKTAEERARNRRVTVDVELLGEGGDRAKK